MKLFKKNENKKTTKLPMTGKVKKGFRYYCMAVMAMTFVLGTSVTAFAANDPIQVVNNLSDFIFGLVRAVGMIMLDFALFVSVKFYLLLNQQVFIVFSYSIFKVQVKI